MPVPDSKRDCGSPREPGRSEAVAQIVKKAAPKRSSAKTPRARRGARVQPGEMNEATGEEFEREGMGIAPKE